MFLARKFWMCFGKFLHKNKLNAWFHFLWNFWSALRKKFIQYTLEALGSWTIRSRVRRSKRVIMNMESSSENLHVHTLTQGSGCFISHAVFRQDLMKWLLYNVCRYALVLLYPHMERKHILLLESWHLKIKRQIKNFRVFL